MLTRGKRERGAIIIHVAFALLALLAFSAFVVDMGVMWVSRGQAQNAADAGALAGAVALMKDGGSSTEAAKSALQWTNNNAIFGATSSAANVRVTFSGPSGTCGTIVRYRRHPALRQPARMCSCRRLPECAGPPVSRRHDAGCTDPDLVWPAHRHHPATGARHGDRGGGIGEHGAMHVAVCRYRPLGGYSIRRREDAISPMMAAPGTATAGRRMTCTRTASACDVYIPPYDGTRITRVGR